MQAQPQLTVLTCLIHGVIGAGCGPTQSTSGTSAASPFDVEVVQLNRGEKGGIPKGSVELAAAAGIEHRYHQGWALCPGAFFEIWAFAAALRPTLPPVHRARLSIWA
jgi:hypothetical protein